MSLRIRAALGVLAVVAGPALAEPLGIAAQPPIADTVDAFPRLTATDPASQRINAALAEQDSYTIEVWNDCGTADTGDLSASVNVDFAGPEFFGVALQLGGYCPGAAHPFYVEEHRVYDLTTGEQTDLLDLLPAMFRPAEDDTTALATAQPEANALYLAQLEADGLLDPECRELFQDGSYSFAYWLDADKQAVGMIPDGLFYAAQACANPVRLPLAQLVALGTDPRLTKALEQAAPIRQE